MLHIHSTETAATPPKGGTLVKTDLVSERERPNDNSGPASFASIFAEGRPRHSPDLIPASLQPEADTPENVPDDPGEPPRDIAGDDAATDSDEVDDSDEADSVARVARDSRERPEARVILAQPEKGEVAKQDMPRRDGGPPIANARSIIAAPGGKGSDRSGPPDSVLQDTNAGLTAESRDVLQYPVPGRESTLQRNVSEPPTLLWPEEPGQNGTAGRAVVPGAKGAEAPSLAAPGVLATARQTTVPVGAAPQATKRAEGDHHISAFSTAAVSGAISRSATSHSASRNSVTVAEDVRSRTETGAASQRDLSGAGRAIAEGQDVIAKPGTTQVATPAGKAVPAESIGTAQPDVRAKSEAVIQGHGRSRPEAAAPSNSQKQPRENNHTLPQAPAPEADFAELPRPARPGSEPTSVIKPASPSPERSAPSTAVAQLAAERTARPFAKPARASADASVVRDAATSRIQTGQNIAQPGASPPGQQDMPKQEVTLSETRVRPVAEPDETSTSAKGPAWQSSGPKTQAAAMTPTPTTATQVPGASRLGEDWSRGLEVDASRTTASGALTSQVETSAPLRPNAPMSALSPELPRHVAEQLASGFRSGTDKSVEIRLNPAELGRVRINLQTNDTGVVVVVLADRPETLYLMRRHTDILAQEFQQIGYGAAEFSFGQGSDARSGQGSNEDRESHRREGAVLEADTREAAEPGNTRAQIALDRVDIRL